MKNQKTKTGQEPLYYKGLKMAYTAKETCDLLGISRRTLTSLVSQNLIIPSRGIRHLRFTTDAIKCYLDETMAAMEGSAQ